MNPIFGAALEVQELCRGKGWRFCFIGGLAVQRWGEPRLTVDVDLTLVTGFGGEEAYVDELLAHFPGRLTDARAFALRHRVVLIQNDAAIPIDVSLGAMPFEERTVERASDWPIQEGCALFTCTAEDLIVHKTFAGREKDWLDVEGVAVRRAGALNEGLIWRELDPLLELKGSRSAAERLRKLLESARP